MPAPGPGRVACEGLQQSIATREPNLDPRRETICFLLVAFCQDRYDLIARGESQMGSSLPDVASDQLPLVGSPVH